MTFDDKLRDELMDAARRENGSQPPRLPVETFDIPAAEIRRGYRSAIYFNRAKTIAAATPGLDNAGVVMQVFQKTPGAVLCGIDEALAILRVGTGRWINERNAEVTFDRYMQYKLAARGAGSQERIDALRQLVQMEQVLDSMWRSEFDQLTVTALRDGDGIDAWEPAAHIKGRYSSFAHLESVYLGVLARRTLVATNTRRVVDAANGKPVLFFADRFDHWTNQGGDGYAAKIGGATGFASDAMASWWGERGIGTMPHALIAFHHGNIIETCEAFQKHYPDTNLIALVDFWNDCVTEALACAEAFGDQLYGVRLDTSENLVDASIAYSMGDFKPTGVNPRLVENVRDALDRAGHQHVKILVSGGFNPQKIALFEAAQVPVDSYAVGSSLLHGSNDFTADIVHPVAKQGRWVRESNRLRTVV